MATIHGDVVRERSRENVERFFVFTLCVPGKPARVISDKVRAFLSIAPAGLTPLDQVRHLVQSGRIRSALEQVRMGQYQKLTRAFEYVVSSGIDPLTCAMEELERVPGAGPKTVRYFLLYTRDDARVAVLDTHILRYMREVLGVEAPAGTPASPSRYRTLEAALVDHAATLGLTIRELDDRLWNLYNRKVPVATPADVLAYRRPA